MELSELSPRLVRRAEQAAREALGCTKVFQLDRKRRVTGVVVECAPHHGRERAGSVVVVFRFVLECGPAKVRREFFGEQIPR